ncbi:MAG: fluoride efflux transporter CrcB [Opitutales bacterium]|nr:fluoride efflux transporter CrcB [Opitutales bacterium]
MEWKHFVLIGFGGGLGSAFRAYVAHVLRGGFPWWTFLVNVAGCFLIGFLMRELDEERIGLRFFLVTGFCGGFTTFSAFGSETMELLRAGEFGAGLGNVALTLACCLAAVAAGHELAKG